MEGNLTRRQFLRAAGGITFLALVPTSRGLFAKAPALQAVPAPIFTALPYIQPGPDGRLRHGGETVRIAWQTEFVFADFEVRYAADKSFTNKASIVRTQRPTGDGTKPRKTLNYVSALTRLELGREVLLPCVLQR